MKKDPESGYTLESLISIFLHIALVGGLIIGAEMTRVKQPKLVGQSIEAVVIDPQIVSAQANKIRQQREEAKRQESERLQRIEKKAAQLEQERELEEARLRQLRKEKLEAEKAARAAEVERKKLAAEKRKAEEDARLAREKAKAAEEERKRKLAEKRQAEVAAKKAEEARQAAEAERKRQIAETKRAEEAAKQAELKRKRLEEQKRKAEEEAKKAEAIRQEAERKAEEAKRKKAEHEALLNELFTGLESETEVRSSARGQQVDDEVSRWASRYVSIIQQNWILDENQRNQSCVLNLQLSSDGLVFNVEKLSGSEILCRSAKASVFKISQFPVPSDPDVMDKLRDINLNFEP